MVARKENKYKIDDETVPFRGQKFPEFYIRHNAPRQSAEKLFTLLATRQSDKKISTQLIEAILHMLQRCGNI